MATRTSDYGLNADVNLAAYLAENGGYAEALDGIGEARARFVQESGRDQVAGSLRHFDWIRGCALHGLGRIDEAKALYDALADVATPSDRNFLVTPTADIRARAAMCIDDPERYAQVLALDSVYPVGPVGLLVLQPGLRFPHRPDWFERVAREPALVAAFAHRYRQLPAEMLPALNRWRAPAAAD